MATRRSNDSRRTSQSSVGTGTEEASGAPRESAAPARPRKRSSDSKQDATRPAGAVSAGVTVSADVRRGMIAEAAYLRAERRGFAAGHEVEDWLAAEKEVDAQLASGHVWGGPQ